MAMLGKRQQKKTVKLNVNVSKGKKDQVRLLESPCDKPRLVPHFFLLQKFPHQNVTMFDKNARYVR